MTMCAGAEAKCAVCVRGKTQWWNAVSYSLKVQALVDSIVPPTTAITGYTIGLEKLQVFCWCSIGSKFVTVNSNYIRHL